MPSPRVLLIGGHGQISLLMTPHLLARTWHVTSLIRDSKQKADILATDKNKTGNVEVLVASVEDVKSQLDAKKILDQTKPDYVIWSAGAGGGSVSRTYAIDRDACSHFIRSAISTPSIKRFLLVSAILSRRGRAPWWSDEDWAIVQRTNTEVMPDYYKAKLAADEVLTTLGEERAKKDSTFSYVVLRPGTLSNDAPTAKVSIGRTRGTGKVSRSDVADVAVRLLESGNSGWFDLLEGEAETGSEIDRVLKEGINSMEGESLDEMRSKI